MTTPLPVRFALRDAIVKQPGKEAREAWLAIRGDDHYNPVIEQALAKWKKNDPDSYEKNRPLIKQYRDTYYDDDRDGEDKTESPVPVEAPETTWYYYPDYCFAGMQVPTKPQTGAEGDDMRRGGTVKKIGPIMFPASEYAFQAYDREIGEGGMLQKVYRLIDVIDECNGQPTQEEESNAKQELFASMKQVMPFMYGDEDVMQRWETVLAM
jgi:hypothetical protein